MAVVSNNYCLTNRIIHSDLAMKNYSIRYHPFYILSLAEMNPGNLPK